MTIRAEKQAYINDVFSVTFSAKKLNSGRAVFQPNPFIVISRFAHVQPILNKHIQYINNKSNIVHRKNEASTFVPVWQSVVKSNTDKPRWEPTRIPMTTLCNGDRFCPLLIQVFDFDRSGKNKFVGEFETSVNVLEANSKVGKENFLVDSKKKAVQKGYIHSGTLSVNNLQIETNPTFLDVRTQKLVCSIHFGSKYIFMWCFFA